MDGRKWATYNANSIRARLPLILDWLKKERPWCLLIQETKVQDKDFPASAFDEAGYKSVFRGQKSYNGVAVISMEPLTDVIIEGMGDEARFICAMAGDVKVINVYVPQGLEVGSERFSYKLKWMGDFLSFLKKNCDPGEAIIVGGDFNVALEPMDVYDPEGLKGQVGFHPDEQAAMRAILDWGLADLLRMKHPGVGGIYTFWDYRAPNAFKRRMGWRIDYLLATRPISQRTRDCSVDSGSRNLPKPSDHAFVMAVTD